MALIVETGTGLPDATSYLSVAQADAYFASIGNEEWAALTNAKKETALRKATRNLDVLYGSRYQSDVLTDSQKLLWPRVPFHSMFGRHIEGIPDALVEATAQLALMGLTTDVLAAPDREDNIKSTTSKLDGVSERTVEYFEPAHPRDGMRPVEVILREVLLGSEGMSFIPVVRG